jgi:hypothetical protein
MGIIFRTLVLRLLKKKCFYFSKEGVNTVFNEPHIKFIAMEF